jgi:hypothetical protein
MTASLLQLFGASARIETNIPFRGVQSQLLPVVGVVDVVLVGWVGTASCAEVEVLAQVVNTRRYNKARATWLHN